MLDKNLTGQTVTLFYKADGRLERVVVLGTTRYMLRIRPEMGEDEIKVNKNDVSVLMMPPDSEGGLYLAGKATEYARIKNEYMAFVREHTVTVD